MEPKTPKPPKTELELAFTRLLNELKPAFNQRPNFQSLLFLIGVQELGQLHRSFTKEEKQDLMHLAVCRLLSQCGYYELESHDPDGWPHYRQLKPLPQETRGLAAQENLLKQQMLVYFGKPLPPTP